MAHFATLDNATTVEGANYFDEAADLLRVGDMILLNIDTDGTPETRVIGVSDVTNGVVTLGVEPNKAAFVADASGGATVDAECRTQLAALSDALIASGQMAAS